MQNAPPGGARPRTIAIKLTPECRRRLKQMQSLALAACRDGKLLVPLNWSGAKQEIAMPDPLFAWLLLLVPKFRLRIKIECSLTFG